MSILLFSIAFGGAALVLAYRRAPLWLWVSLDAAAIAVAVHSSLHVSIIALLSALGLVALSACIGPIRKKLYTGPLFRWFVRQLPPVSDTEREALAAGTVWWDADLFSGRPRWSRLLEVPSPQLTEREQAFIDGPLEQLCNMIDDWEINRVRREIPPAIWDFLKRHGFFGMIIDPAYGGLGFSVQAQSEVVSRIASRSIAVAVTVMVPNSLGPGELLHRFGTREQREHYLGRLARGEEIPAFALTGPYSGSDAASMRDVGVVCYGLVDGRRTLGIRLNWEKRYITLGPVATVLGVAFKLYDPDGLLGKGENLGITLALVPTDWPGVEIGRRHSPAGQVFPNGPNRGVDVFIPLRFVIGESEGVGRGWSMLMSCLAAGRAVSLPAMGTAATKLVARTTSAYARVRRQFGIPIGQMEGVEEVLARIAGQAYVLEAARLLTNAAIDQGHQPSVISAILKLESTERMRRSVNDAMDVLAGKGLCDGPKNLLFNCYASVPIAITVEGANILTRSLIVFAQGAIRCHPWLQSELDAAQQNDQAEGLERFDKAIRGHCAHFLGNIAGVALHNLTAARLVPAPRSGEASPDTIKWFRHLGRASQNFALLADVTLVLLGGSIKRRQRLAGRFADILGELYMMSAALKRFEDDGRPAGDLPFVKWAMVNGLHRVQDAFEAIFQNYPSRPIAWALRRLVFPLGRHFEPVRDGLEHEMVQAMLQRGGARERLARGVFIPDDPNEPLTQLERTFAGAERADRIRRRVREAVRAGEVQARPREDRYGLARDAGVIDSDEHAFISEFEVMVRAVIDVDDFSPNQISAHAPLAQGDWEAPRRTGTA